MYYYMLKKCLKKQLIEVEPTIGIEPMTSSLPRMRSTN